MREFVIRQAMANRLNIGYGLQIRSQQKTCVVWKQRVQIRNEPLLNIVIFIYPLEIQALAIA